MRLLLLPLVLLVCIGLNAQTPVYDILPMPAEVQPSSGFFDWNNAAFDKIPAPFAFFETWVNNHKQGGNTKNKGGKPNIFCRRKQELGPSKSVIAISPDKIDISAGDDAGFFYAAQTLIQLAERNGNSGIPCAVITDAPRFGWRGVHLDESRHFMGKTYVLKLLDQMAALKMNRFHWHLTDAQGWRIEMKKYPKLTSVGAWRPDRTGILNSEADTAKAGEPMTYGGFYTQEEIKEVVEYAARRQITVIPEIEMPGHATSAMNAYPEFSCTGGPFAVCGGAKNCPYPNFCIGNDATLHFLEDILKEVMVLFPSEYIHIGGDEVERDQWARCSKCRHRKDSLGLADEAQLQVWFTKYIEQFLVKNNRRLLGWDEIMEGGNLTASSGVMVWRGEDLARQATLAGHEVVLAHHYYFNQYQGRPESEPVSSGYLPLESVYRYSRVPEGFSEKQRSKILGLQACLWTENVNNPREAEYMLFPRLLALAEVAWSPEKQLDWERFSRSLPGWMAWLDKRNVNFATSIFNPTIRVEPGGGGQVVCRLAQQVTHGEIRYTTNGTAPGKDSPVYTEPFPLSKPCIIKATAFWDKTHSKTIIRHYKPSLATGKSFQLANLPAKQYNGDTPEVLTDGLEGALEFHDGNWCGFYGEDFDMTIDLGSEQTLHRISINWLEMENSWIYLPLDMQIEISRNGINWDRIYELKKEGIAAVSASPIKDVNVIIDEQDARYIRITGKNPGRHPKYPDGKCWLFVDEVQVR